MEEGEGEGGEGEGEGSGGEERRVDKDGGEGRRNGEGLGNRRHPNNVDMMEVCKLTVLVYTHTCTHARTHARTRTHTLLLRVCSHHLIYSNRYQQW